MNSSSGRPISVQWVAMIVAITATCGYVGIARSVQDLYPFSSYTMYAGVHGTWASRLVARPKDGIAREIKNFDHWQCQDELPAEANRTCAVGEGFRIDYMEAATMQYVNSFHNQAPGDQEVDLVRRVWQFDAQGVPLPAQNCIRRHCRAQRIADDNGGQR